MKIQFVGLPYRSFSGRFCDESGFYGPELRHRRCGEAEKAGGGDPIRFSQHVTVNLTR